MKINIANKIKPLKYSLIIASLLSVGCSETKESTVHTVRKGVSSIDNAEYFLPPRVAIESLEDDRLSKFQWHLINEGQHSGAYQGGRKGEDINISDVWDQYRGNGIKIAIVDTGVEAGHPDLKDNIDLENSYNYATNTNDPTSGGNEENPGHGTACAGIAAAVGYNTIGIRGVAPLAQIVGLDVMPSGRSFDFADALYRSKEIDVYSNSWGNAVISKIGMDPVEMDSIEQGTILGRGGLGSVYVFSAGNKRAQKHNGNYYEEQNNRFVISVAAADANGNIATYSNPGANILVTGFGGEDGRNNPAVVTTDLMGFDKGLDALYGDEFGQMNIEGNENGEYTHLMNGTSAATPMVAGAVALILEAGKNQNLTYRDVKYILATTARKGRDEFDDKWVKNGGGHYVHHYYGFGIIDVKNAVERAKNFNTLGDEIISSYYLNNDSQVFSDESISQTTVSNSSVNRIEFVDIWVDIDYQEAKDLEISLVSPTGTVSLLAERNDVLPNNFFNGWRFGSVRHLDEGSNGIWKLKITNRANPQESIKLNSWKLRFYGH